MEALQKLTKGIDKSAKKRKKKGKAPKPKQWEKLKLNRDKLGEILTREVDGNPAEQNKFKRNVQALVDANAEYKKAEGAFKDSVINTLVSFGTPLPSEKEDDDHHDTSHGPADPEKPPPFECSLTYFITMFQRQIHWMQENSLPLLFGVIIAMILANTVADDYDYYLGGGREVEPHHVVDHIVSLVNATDSHGDAAEGGHLRRLSAGGKEVFEVVCISFFGHAPSLRFVANDLVICFFFGIAAKEITESVLPGGSLNPLKKAATPLIATLGGVLGPIVVYFCLVPIFNAAGMFQGDHDMATLYNGWGIVTATDIALAWVVAKKVFGEGHPAIDFLLLLAIADDGIGLIIVAIFYGDPNHPVQPIYLLVTMFGMLVAYGFRKIYYSRPIGQRIHQSWCLYVCICGPISWIGLIKASLHPALALCFIVPFMPGPEHAEMEAAKKKEDDKLLAELGEETQLEVVEEGNETDMSEQSTEEPHWKGRRRSQVPSSPRKILAEKERVAATLAKFDTHMAKLSSTKHLQRTYSEPDLLLEPATPGKQPLRSDSPELGANGPLSPVYEHHLSMRHMTGMHGVDIHAHPRMQAIRSRKIATRSLQSGRSAAIRGNLNPERMIQVQHQHGGGETVAHGSTLDIFEHECKLFVDVSLGFFAICNAGVKIEGFNGMAWSIYLSLLFGKVGGIVACASIGSALGFPLPKGMGFRHLCMVGLIASIGLTVALFVADSAFEDDGLKGEAKMGSLLSVINGLFAFIISFFMDMKSKEGQGKKNVAAAFFAKKAGNQWMKAAGLKNNNKVAVDQGKRVRLHSGDEADRVAEDMDDDDIEHEIEAEEVAARTKLGLGLTVAAHSEPDMMLNAGELAHHIVSSDVKRTHHHLTATDRRNVHLHAAIPGRRSTHAKTASLKIPNHPTGASPSRLAPLDLNPAQLAKSPALLQPLALSPAPAPGSSPRL